MKCHSYTYAASLVLLAGCALDAEVGASRQAVSGGRSDLEFVFREAGERSEARRFGVSPGRAE